MHYSLNPFFLVESNSTIFKCNSTIEMYKNNRNIHRLLQLLQEGEKFIHFTFRKLILVLKLVTMELSPHGLQKIC